MFMDRLEILFYVLIATFVLAYVGLALWLFFANTTDWSLAFKPSWHDSEDRS